MQELLKKYQTMFRLQDWDIELVEDDSLDVEGQTLLIWNDYKVVIKIRKKNSPEEKEKTLIHELLHMIYRDAYDLFEQNIENKAIKEYTNRQHERAIEKTARIIYGLTRKE